MKNLKSKLKQAIIITLVLFFTLSAVGINAPLFTLFGFSAITVAIGYKRIKPLLILCGVFLALMILSSGSIYIITATLNALFNLAVGVAIAVVSVMLFIDKYKFKNIKKKFF